MNLESKKLLTEFTAKLETLYNELAKHHARPELRATPSKIQELDIEIMHMEKAVAALEKSLKLSPTSSTQSCSTLIKPPSLPAFSRSKNHAFNVNNFIQIFEAQLSAASVPESQWSSFLMHCVPTDDLPTTNWVSKNVIPFPWDQAKNKILSHFLTPDIRLHALSEFRRARPNPQEPLPVFLDRFTSLMHAADVSAVDFEAVHVLVNALPEDIHKMVISTVASMSSTDDIIDHCLKIFFSSKFLSKPKTSQEVFSVSRCNFCSSRGHNEADCRKKHHVYSPKKEQVYASSAKQEISPRSSPICHKCGILGHYSNACTTIPLANTKKPSLNKTSANFSTISTMPLAQASQIPDSPPILVPISIQEQNTLALLDTGAACSFISPLFYSKITSNQPLPISVSIETILQGSSFHPLGVSAPLEIRFGTSTVLSTFLVADITNDHQVILGRDLLPKFGITIGNIPADFPHLAQLPSSTTDNAPAELKPPVNAQPISDDEMHHLKKELQQCLATNKQTSNLFCTIPEALVHLDTGSESPSFVKQYVSC